VIIDPCQFALEKGAAEGVTWDDESDTTLGSLGTEMRRFIKLDPTNTDVKFDDSHHFLLPKWVRGFTIGTRGSRDWGKSHYGTKFQQSLLIFVAWLNVDDIVKSKNSEPFFAQKVE
jgi:hypothetical protein